ncbi:hypothetical protein NQ314_018860 [Rhamnusium bicolor]|uniref:Chitin deacetylase n=1 Tax=Rhamnusium bicolor TaxID=1586634 RepID=A0AAV8WPZ0_9CUCU|nr:hypothetical protein NQ314_018860 [Rhamnusium bicolor]
MKTLVLLGFCIGAGLAVPGFDFYEQGVQADDCSDSLISLTFDEAVTEDLYNNFWEPLLFSRVNPDGVPIGATFFVPHEYTDYERVNDLYNYGFEIGVHSITKNNLQSYWRSASEPLLEQEFGGQRKIIAKFANIPIDDILGVRTPQLQLAGNVSIEAYQGSGLIYDSSWPTLPEKALYPYTLDYLTTQQCNLGSRCPNEAFRGFWILPINDLNGDEKECNTLASCNITGTANDIADWLVGEIDRVRRSTRVPLTLLVNSYWFDFTENSLQGFTLFLDRLAAHYNDVFLVTQKQILDWIKNPVPVSEFQTEFPERNANCNPYSCALKTPDNADRYMKSCIPCPAAYPWLGNPDGNIQ